MTRWARGEQSVRYLVGRGRLESFEAGDLEAVAEALIGRAALRVQTTATARQGLRAPGGDGSHAAVEDAVSAQFADDIPEFAKPTFERFRRTRHSAQYFDPTAAPITKQDASWAIGKATAALSGVRALLLATPPGRFD